MKNHILISLLALIFYTPIIGQDLIERTRLELQPDKSKVVNPLAKLITKKWNPNKAKGAGVNLFEYNEDTGNRRLESAPVTDAVYLDLNKGNLKDLLETQPAQMSFVIPVNDKSSISLDLIKTDAFASDFEILLSDGTTLAAPKDAIFYKGIVTGNTNSLVALSIFKDDIQGVISDSDGNYVLGKLKDVDQFTLFNDFKYKSAIPFSCMTGDENLVQTADIIRSTTNQAKRSAADVCVKIYFELDFFSYNQLGNSVSNSTNFLMGLFNSVQTVFLNEMINIEMTTPKIWTSNDPYGGVGGSCNSSTVLSNFRNEIGDNFDGDLAHLITVVGSSGSICGQGSLNCSCDSPPSVCNEPAWCNSFFDNAQAYSQTYNFFQGHPNHSISVSLVSHELGHNFGSPHTHACAWNGNNTAIDGCVNTEPQTVYGPGCSSTTATCGRPGVPANGGTIMSYCSNRSIANGFGTQPGDLMRTNVANATCLTACANSDNSCTVSDRVVSSDPPSGVTDAINTIVTSGDVQATGTVTFVAGSSITLNANFEVPAGNTFTAVIQSCASLQQEETPVSALIGLSSTTTLPQEKVGLSIRPNPFSFATTIDLFLPEESLVNMYVYNLGGQLVDQIIQNESLIKGTHNISYDASGLGKGMYHLVLNTSGELQTKKLVVIK